MSTYYEFYLGKKNEDGQISICGPYMFNKDGDLKLRYLYITSRSFIDWDGFKEFMEPIAKEDMEPSQLSRMCTDVSWSNEEVLKSSSYICSLSEMARHGITGGLRQGYIPLSDFRYLKAQNYYIENIYDLEDFRTIEEIAEMDYETRKGYGKVAFMETCSVDYIANLITTAASGLVGYDSDEYYVICVVDY